MEATLYIATTMVTTRLLPPVIVSTEKEMPAKGSVSMHFNFLHFRGNIMDRFVYFSLKYGL